MEYQELQQLMNEQCVEMTPTERLAAYLNGESVDFLPYDLIEITRALEPYVPKKLMQGPNLIENAINWMKNEKGFARIGSGMGLLTMGEAVGSAMYFPKGGRKSIKSYVLNDYADFSALTIPDPFTNRVLKGTFAHTRNLRRLFPEAKLTSTIAGPLTVAGSIMPPEKLLKDTRKNPEKLKEVIEFSNACSLAWLKAYSEEFGPSVCTIYDPLTSTSLISRKQFEEFSLPYLRELIAKVISYTGSKPILHICGKSEKIWDPLADLDIAGFSLDECENLAQAKEVMGDRVMLIGNVETTDVLLHGTIDQVIAAVKANILAAGDSPCGYMPCSGCMVPRGTPIENIDAFIFAVRHYGRDARMGEMPAGATAELIS